MKIGIISDTHGSIDDFNKAVELLESKGVEKIIHLGDVLYHGPRNPLPENYRPKEVAEKLKVRDDIIFIKGNCDSEVDQMVIGKDLSESEKLIDLDGKKWYLIHGHQKAEYQLVERAKELGADVVAYGHTHIKVLEDREGLIVLNPGSTTFPKDESKSLALYDDGKFKLIDLSSGEVVREV